MLHFNNCMFLQCVSVTVSAIFQLGDFLTAHTIKKIGRRIFINKKLFHIKGKALRLRHVRNKIELPPVFQDNYFDPEFQDSLYLAKSRLVLPVKIMYICLLNYYVIIINSLE